MTNRLNPKRKTTPVDDGPVKGRRRAGTFDAPAERSPSVSNALAANNPPKTQQRGKAKKEMTAAELADQLAPIFADLSARATGKWKPKQRKDWDKAANLLQKARGRGRKDPLV